MKNIKFVVKVNREGARPPAYVQRVNPIPIQMTTNRKLALTMGKLTAIRQAEFGMSHLLNHFGRCLKSQTGVLL